MALPQMNSSHVSDGVRFEQGSATGVVPIEARLGQRGFNAVSRLFALLLASIAVETISTGIRALFPILA